MAWEEFEKQIGFEEGGSVFTEETKEKTSTSFEHALALFKRIKESASPMDKSGCPEIEILKKHARLKIKDQWMTKWIQRHLLACPRCSKTIVFMIYLNVGHDKASKTDQACADWIRDSFEKSLLQTVPGGL